MRDQIRYDILAQDALRGVIRKVLSEVSATGSLPGDHHFYITFLTNAPGVRISSYLKERYSEQMTIVIQHQFWDLKVSDSYFEIGLSFSDKPEKLHIPFAAIRGFFDPSVNFELEFETMVADNEDQPRLTSPEDAEDELEDGKAEERIEKARDAAESGDESKKEKEKKPQDGSSADVVSLDAFRNKN